MSDWNRFFFDIYPYIAGTVFIVGSVLRFDFGQYTWKSGSSQMLSGGRHFMLGNNLFHIGILLLFCGHLIGLLMPHSWYPYLGLTVTDKQLLAMIAGGIFGSACLVGMTLILRRRLFDRRVRANSSPMDIAILLILYVQLILGLITIFFSAGELNGSIMIALSDWAQHIVTFRGGAAAFVAHAPLVYRVHLVLGMTVFLLFPFSRLVHIWSAPVWYLGRRYQVVRVRS